MKLKLVVLGTAVIVLSSAYAFWLDDKKQLPAFADKEAVTRTTMVNNNSEKPLLSNRKPQLVGGANNSNPPVPVAKSLPFPESADSSPRNWPNTVRLWKEVENDSPTMVDGMSAVRLQVNPERLRQLHVGQTLTLDIPHEGTAFEARITSTHNDPAGVKIWRADIAGSLDEAGVIISQGQVQTHLIIASEQGNYSVVIDNKTGESTLIDEGEINAQLAPFDDGIAVGPPDQSALPPIN